MSTERSRIDKACAELKGIMVPGGKDYFTSDKDLAVLLGVSTPIVRRHRRTLGILPRDLRILAIVEGMGCAFMEGYLAKLPGVDYHCLYMLLRKHNIAFLRKNK